MITRVKLAGAVALAAAISIAIPAVEASFATTQPTTVKQRISLVGTFSTLTGSGTWRLIPLTPGPLERDSGSLTGSGSAGRTILRNGQRVTIITGGDTLTGKRGLLAVSQRVESTDVGRRYSADVGTWRLKGQLGAYKGVTGTGRFAAVGLPNGTIIVNQEGWVTVP